MSSFSSPFQAGGSNEPARATVSGKGPAGAPAAAASAASSSAGEPTARGSTAQRYALSDDQYKEWSSALAACKASPQSAEALRPLAGRPELLNWRNPASGQTLLTALATCGAAEDVIQAAVEMGCDASQRNRHGETASMVQQRKRCSGAVISEGGRGTRGFVPAARSRQAARRAWSNVQGRNVVEGRMMQVIPMVLPISRAATAGELPVQQQLPPPMQQLPPPPLPLPGRQQLTPPMQGQPSPVQQQLPPPMQQQLPPPMQQQPWPVQQLPPAMQQQLPPPVQQQPWPAQQQPPAGRRRSGYSLASNEVASVPKAQMQLDMDWSVEQTLDRAELTEALQKTYGPRARIQIDEVTDKSTEASRTFRGKGVSRVQNVRARVLFDDAREAQQQQMRSADGRSVQASLAAQMRMEASVVDFEEQARTDEVDVVTLKLDSDSSSILCGACLMYNAEGACEKVVCHSDRFFCGAVQHSGDTIVDGKSVHTISVAMSKLPAEVSELYFTLCSCGPSDLSGFKNPNIMLYDPQAPDANLLEYTIEQAARAPSCVMAKMLRQPAWSAGDAAVIARALRKLKTPLLCIELCMAMAAQSTWVVQALGSEQWHCGKVCSNYHIAQAVIEARLRAAGAPSAPP